MANAIGIHLSFWQTSWSDDLLPLISRAKTAGFKVAEFPLLDPINLNYPLLRKELDRLEMLASCSTGLGPETDVTHPDPAIREKGLEYLFACLEGADILGSPILGGVTYAPWGVFPTDDLSKRRDHCIQSLKIAVEQAQDIIQEVGSPNIKIQLDTFHLNIEADDFGLSIRKAGADLGHFHCVANNRKPPGQGHIPWSEVQQALKEIGYSGYLVAETFVNPEGDVGRGLSIWRPLAEDLDLAARQAAEFISSNFN